FHRARKSTRHPPPIPLSIPALRRASMEKKHPATSRPPLHSPKPSPAVAGRPFRVSKGGGGRRPPGDMERKGLPAAAGLFSSQRPETKPDPSQDNHRFPNSTLFCSSLIGLPTSGFTCGPSAYAFAVAGRAAIVSCHRRTLG